MIDMFKNYCFQNILRILFYKWISKYIAYYSSIFRHFQVYNRTADCYNNISKIKFRKYYHCSVGQFPMQNEYFSRPALLKSTIKKFYSDAINVSFRLQNKCIINEMSVQYDSAIRIKEMMVMRGSFVNANIANRMN